MNLALPSDLKQRLELGLPDRSALDRFAPVHTRQWRFSPPPSDARLASVVALLYPARNQWHVPLVLRPSHFRHHQGQIGLPGGAADPGEDLAQTAQRELQEELGVHPTQVELIGSLTPFFVPASRFVLHPWLAFSRHQLQFQPSPIEVAELLELPLHSIVAPNALTSELCEFGDNKSEVPFFRCGAHKIWGATCIVLGELANLCEGLNV